LIVLLDRHDVLIMPDDVVFILKHMYHMEQKPGWVNILSNFKYRYEEDVKIKIKIPPAKLATERDSCTRFSTLGFFHQSTPPRTLIHGL
jgi:hypothetical protein